ncbi:MULTISPECIES: outer membrane protein assembly factor BamD [unclassified Flavobacterium]|uniref:outer membrane protein assembly factor BamD n=1 Tax=unclassified Flavobacterium TaxID=196869 RepID=UPI001F133D22|nr:MULTISPECIES: outer membrane protein assembly factor BamD [unclassified Flavobacterium]UMY64406.1 outer membrane protein assembly factor BamD [Flavobacterium sp. HJ-32-4]
MKKLIALLIVLTVLTSCSPYQKALKSEDIAFKYEVATSMYEKGKWDKAIRLFEQIAPSYQGKPQAEKLFYMYSKSFFNSKQYYSAGYQFDKFVSSYPRSEKVEEAAFLSAKSYSMLSPRYSLDQVDTYKAIDKLQAFIDNYPNSEFMRDANAIAKELREKLEKKSFEVARQYNTIMDYKAALVALDNFIQDYPGTPYKEEALYYRLDSAYNLAINSITSKMQERLVAAKAAYNALIKFKADTKYRSEADDMLARIETDLKQFSK